jgi:hypothetical protein
MKKHIHRTIIKSSELIGPNVLWVIIQAIHTANPAMVRLHCTELTHMSIRNIPGENTQTMYAQVIDKCNLIRDNSRIGHSPEDLTNMAIMPFCLGSDEGQRIEAKRLHRLTMLRGCKLTPEKALQELVKAYVANEPIGMYGPTAAARLKGTNAFYSHQQPTLINQQPAPSNQQPSTQQPAQIVLTADQIQQYQAFQAYQSSGLHRSNPPAAKAIASGSNQRTAYTPIPLTDKDRHQLALIKEAKAKMPPVEAIKDTDYFHATDPQNKDEIIGEYCHKCKRWYRKANGSMHWTGKHEKGKGRKAVSPDSAPVAALQAGVPAQAPALAPQQGTMFQLRGANYDTPVAPPGTAAGNLCQIIQPVIDTAPMNGPSNFQPWGQVKGQGGQNF